MPVCKEINCGHPGILYNGWLENIESGTGLGASIIFRCHTDMLLVGNTSTQCQPSGWNYNLPKCLAPCVVPTISQGTVIPMEIEMDPNATTTYAPPTLATATNKVKHGTTLDVICEDHYEFPISSLAAPTCNNGTWSIIPRCVPARCKGLPRPPKYGMVLAPKTEHGMKARFKCKDGYNLTGPGGKEITDYNDYVLTCSFGNWTGETPMCQEVYCSFPGYIPNGKVLLVGNMGLYDYRPYVKKIVNNKQIMYDCDKGYVLDSGPPGATCVGSLWRPTELPSCLLGQHPRLRWNRRRRRSINLKFNPSGTVLKNYRQLLAHLNELNQKENNDFLIRTKKTKNRNTLFYRGQRTRKDRQKRIRRMASQAYEKDHSNHIRSRRDESKIHNHNHHNNPLDLVRSMWHENLMEKYKHYMESILPTKPGHHRNNNTNNKLDFMHYQQFKLNNIFADEAEHYKLNGKYQQKLSNRIGQKEQNTNYLPNTKHSKPIHHNAWNLDWSVIKKNLNDNNMMRPVSLTKRLKSEKRNQRKKRNTDDLLLTYMDNNGKKGKPKEPCTPLTNQPYMRIDMIREGRDPNNMYSAGTILKITCAKEYKLNLQNPNGTAKCVRGRWKPMKPECQLLPCSVPSTEHGSYYNESTFGYVNVSKSMEPKTPLIAFEEIQNGNSIRFQCDMGFTVQGSTELNCIDGQWNVGILPECLPSPCTLPTINNAVYQEGYRGGLNIAHGSFVNIQCENPATNQPVQMTCALGTLTPPTIHCETGARRSREEYLGEVEFVSTGQEINNILNSLNVKLNSGPGNAQGVTGVGNSGVGGSSIIHSANASGNINNNNSNHIVNSVYRSNFATGRDCGSPSKMDNALVYRNGDPVGEMDSGFQSGTEITFNCISSTAGERTTWKIICEDGTWVGRSLNCANGTCIYRNNEPNVVSFYNDLEIREDIVEFPPGATIVSRCVDIGKYTMVGNNVRTCIHSEWTGQRPACFGLNQENDYAMEKSPTILFRHQNGPIAQSNDGKLIVYPGTTIHMECLWMRRFGNPKWIVNHEYRTYPEGWVTEDGRDTQLEYRLSIFHAVEDDSGIFTCQTPARHEHSIDIVVKAINCPEIPNRRGLIINKNDTKLSSRIQLSCANGNSLIGASELLCTPSGNWSAPLPVCESVECGDIPLSQSGNRSIPRVAVLSREVGGRAAFSCQLGYGLNGPSESICLPSGEWATPFPTCLEVQCENPGAPANGYAQGSAPYRAGDVVQFNCNPEYMMQGQPIIACQDNGRWSGGLPKCVQACSYPGTAIAGRMSSVKFYYGIGESITFSCDPGLELRGAKQLKCLRNGKWSNAIPTCVNLESSQNKNEN